MVPKHSLDDTMSSSAKRPRSTTTPIVKRNYRANFDRLCALHNWTPSEIVRDKLAALLQLSGNRLEASELLPLAFVQHYPFIWVKDFLLLGYNDEDESVWYKAFPSGRGMARGRYYNSSQVNILGKHTVTKFWQSWIDVFDIEQRGLDRTHEYFTGVYLILKKFPNLRYKSSKEDARNPQNAIRATGVAEYPFNDDHPFMQETPSELKDVENNEIEAVPGAEADVIGQDQNNVSIKQEVTGLHEDEDRSYLLLRQLSKQFTFRANSHEIDVVTQAQGHTANDRQGSPPKKNGLGSPILYSSMPFDSRADSRGFDVVTQQGHAANERQGLPDKTDGSASLLGYSSMQSDSRAYSREFEFSSQHDANVTSLPRDLSRQPVFYAHSHQSGSPSLSQFDNNSAAHKTARSYAKKGPHIEDDNTPTQPKILPNSTQEFGEITIRVPIEEPRWSNTNFTFAVVTSVSTVPAPVITSIED
ncbi:unnamed protein product [Aureobasidium mustum]|uniref:Uncharacterized protein n=1 Tax=Aureobasidium mustum TaxID=2773714 RepID=A0A9N8K4N3_9PEZI|nr:unnamed protein product [Aureobasidium mustum]